MSESALISRLDQILRQYRDLGQRLSQPEVLADHRKVTELSQQRAAIESIAEQYDHYRTAMAEAENLRQMIAEEKDADLRAMAELELPDVEQRAEQLLEHIKGELVTSEDRAVGSVILEIRAGVGGDEAGIWAGDLFEMYERYAQAMRWRWEPMEYSPADHGGCKNATVNVKGDGVWQHLGYEGGTHCVKRVPETETQGRVHTSTATIAVLPEPKEVDVQINEADVRMDITTARGPGGQNVNKVATAVKLLHIPTGIEVRMQDTKSQHQNRHLAWQLLRARLHEHAQKKVDAERADARNKMIGSGERGERIRTYRWKDNQVVDHRIGQSFNLQTIMAGQMQDLIAALMEHDKAQRLAAL